jgi:hypothetical protein
MKWSIQITIYLDQPAFIQFGGALELCTIQFWIPHHRAHSSDNGFISPKKIKEGDQDKQNEAQYESKQQERDLTQREKLLILCKGYGMPHIKHQEEQGYYGVIDTILEERVCSSCKEFKMPTEENKGGDIPTHDKHRGSRSNYGCTKCIHLSQILRGQKQ